jgi:hypothetical protein
MDLSRAVCSGDLKILAMRALDAGSTNDEIARKYHLSRKLMERWRGEWRRQRRIHLVTSLQPVAPAGSQELSDPLIANR